MMCVKQQMTIEIERRRQVIGRILRHRERVGPIGLRVDDLLDEAHTETER